MRKLAFLLVFVGLLGDASASFANTENFKVWLGGMRQEAKTGGISEKTLKIALPDTLKPIEKIIKLDRKQPEGTRTFKDYRAGVVSKKRIDDGRARWRDHKQSLYEIGANYGVDPQYIVALWGIETNYGRNTGGYDVVQALATLAYDGRRSQFFRTELLKALKIIDGGDIAHKNMKGSWAGAMGQTQFMPSSFFSFAQDYNKDGKRDIWTTHADIFASAANYLSKSGWKHGEPWGRKVKLPENFDSKLAGLDNKHSLDFWHKKGVRLPGGESVPFEGAYQASIVRPDGAGGDAYIVYDNYRVLMKWNKSTYFATSVGLLADAVKG